MIARSAKYISDLQRALALLRMEEIEAGCGVLADAVRHGRGVYLCGNGGSASTASHLAVDLGRAFRRGGGPRVRSATLTDNVPWLTAAANDECYAECFADQLRSHLSPADLLIGISASGDSENVVRAFELASEIGARRLALIGFDGGRCARLATHRIWVDSHDYGIVESVHVFVGHLLVKMLVTEMRPSTEACAGRDTSEGLIPAAAARDDIGLSLAAVKTVTAASKSVFKKAQE